MEWSYNDMWLLSGDHNGVIKYWQSNMNNVKMLQAHNDPIRGLRCDYYYRILKVRVAVSVF